MVKKPCCSVIYLIKLMYISASLAIIIGMSSIYNTSSTPPEMKYSRYYIYYYSTWGFLHPIFSPTHGLSFIFMSFVTPSKDISKDNQVPCHLWSIPPSPTWGFLHPIFPPTHFRPPYLLSPWAVFHPLCLLWCPELTRIKVKRYSSLVLLQLPCAQL